jgi:hypothetical protein
MIKDLSWLTISDVFAPNIRQISCNKVIICGYPNIRIWGADTVHVYQYQVPVHVAKSRNIRISGRRIHSFASKSRNIRISGRQIHSFAAKSRNIRYPNRLFYIRMVLQKHKISQNILQDIRAGPTRVAAQNFRTGSSRFVRHNNRKASRASEPPATYFF